MKDSGFDLKIILLVLLTIFTCALSVHSYADTEQTPGQSNAEVMQAFTSQEVETSDIVNLDDQTKRVVMFSMGVPLLLFLIVTGALGVAMGVYGKQVFVAHMVFAGLSITLAMAHAVVGIVWFYPF